MMNSLKGTVRKELKAKLRKLSEGTLKFEIYSWEKEYKEKDSYPVTGGDQIIHTITNLKCYQDSQNISIYLHMPTMEVQTRNLMLDIFKRGKNCYVPRWDKDTMDMVKLDNIEDLDSLPVNNWNIPEPDFSKPRETVLEDRQTLDLIFMPGVGFDRNCHRIGHGKGYYDKFLHHYHQLHHHHPTTVGLALTHQLLPTVPIDPHDVTLDYVVTPDQIYQPPQA